MRRPIFIRRPTFLSGAIFATFGLAIAQQACGSGQDDQNDPGAEAETEARHDEASGGAIHWSYEGDAGTDMWGSLDPSFAICDSGMRQSPVDIVGSVAGGPGELDIRWQPADAEVVDNGHTIQVNVPEGSAITLEGREFGLVQFLFHTPSEHAVDGRATPLEVHFVHAAAEGDLAVIGVFMEAGEADPAIQAIWDAIPAPGDSPGTLAAFDPRALLPAAASHFRYPGSLTTPPCSEIVSWVVMTQSITVSQDQLDAFAAIHPMNARPMQALNDRTIEFRR